MLAEEKQSALGLRLTNIGAGLIQVFEAILVIAISTISLSKGIDSLSEIAPTILLQDIIEVARYTSIGILFILGFMAADLMKWLLYSGLLFFKKKDFVRMSFYFVGLCAVAFGFYHVEKNASANIGHSYFSIEDDKTKYTDDANYNLRMTEKDKIQSYWNERKKELEKQKSQCPACAVIESKRNSEIAGWRKRRIVTAADSKFVADNIDAISRARDREVSEAEAQRAVEIDAKYSEEEASFKSQRSAADNTLKTITSKIDTGRVLNAEEAAERNRKIDFWASGFSWITLLAQILLRIARFHFLISADALDEIWDENNLVLDALQAIPFIGKYFEDNYWAEKSGNFKRVKEVNRLKYSKTESWNTELKNKREARYWTFIREKSIPNTLSSRLYFFVMGNKVVADEDIYNEFSSAYDNGYYKNGASSTNGVTDDFSKSQDSSDFPQDDFDEKKNDINEDFDENIVENEGDLQQMTDIETINNLIDGLNSLVSISEQSQILLIHNLIDGLEQLKTLY